MAEYDDDDDPLYGMWGDQESEEEDWERGQCPNCGIYADEVGPGEFQCPQCGDFWNENESPPEVP